jgi:hypothetical protein
MSALNLKLTRLRYRITTPRSPDFAQDAFKRDLLLARPDVKFLYIPSSTAVRQHRLARGMERLVELEELK